MATDIAFVVGCLALLGSRVPAGLRITLLSLAIADDIGAIAVIAVGYTAGLDLPALAGGLLGIVAVVVLQRLGVRSIGVYTVAGVAVWIAFLHSGVHATIAGVILGLMTPAGRHAGEPSFARLVHRVREALGGEPERPDPERTQRVRSLRRVTRELVSPVEYLEAALHPWVGFVVMPVFALANAGVAIGLGDLGSPIAVAVALGLVIGKPVGIVAASWLGVRAGLARLPDEVGWGALAGGGVLAGIGFTMALFIAGLALEGAALDAAKVGILCGSVLAAAAGLALLTVSLPARTVSPG